MLGISLATKKVEGPTTCLDFLGIQLDTVSMEARLPEDKLIKTRTTIQEWLNRRSATKREILSLVGPLPGRPSAARRQSGSPRSHICQPYFYVSQPQRKCLSFLARSSILPLWLGSKYFRKHGSVEYSRRPESLHSQFRWAIVRRAKCYDTSQCKNDCHKYSSKSPNLNFANNLFSPFRQILMPAKFSRYTVSYPWSTQNFIVLRTWWRVLLSWVLLSLVRRGFDTLVPFIKNS